MRSQDEVRLLLEYTGDFDGGCLQPNVVRAQLDDLPQLVEKYASTNLKGTSADKEKYRMTKMKDILRGAYVLTTALGIPPVDAKSLLLQKAVVGQSIDKEYIQRVVLAGTYALGYK